MLQNIKPYIYIVMLTLPSIVAAAPECEKWIAKMVSTKGRVEKQRLDQDQWRQVEKNEYFCQGDRIRTQKHSLVTLELGNESLVTLEQRSTLTFPIIDKGSFSWLLELFQGSAFFRSRSPHQLKIDTPFVNAVHEGTEFMVTVNDQQTEISVFDGRVAAENKAGRVQIDKGQIGIAAKGQITRVQALTIHPKDAVQWALYYPPIIDYQGLGTTPTIPAIQQSLNFYQQGDVYQALNTLDNIPEKQQDQHYLGLKASLLLTVGSVDEALQEIERAQQLEATSSTASAIKAIIAVTKNHGNEALKLAQNAIELNPNSAVAKIALSYAYQATFKIPEALEATEQAVKLAPNNALAWARLAELQLSSGERSDALESAQKAQRLNPQLDRTQTILGFANLAQIDIDEAKTAFTQAIDLNSADPLARLGLGLAKIRKGAIEEGTRDLETAVSLDPDNAIMRSYLGKAYYELKNEGYAATELAIAKEMDPNDPTPWFYDAILKQTTNRPVEALHDMQKAIELNDNRGVYRSKLLLDEDLAARSASLGRIYNDLGFEQQGLVESWKSINADPANFSAHRLLADNYAALPRHEIARVSELLQAQLLQPINASPLQPQLAQNNLNTLGVQGPSTLSVNEYNPLFLKDGVSFVGNGTFGSNNLWSEDAIVSGVYKNISASFGQFHFETDGFQENADLKQDIYNGFVQVALTDKFSVQAQVTRVEIENGDLITRANASRRRGFRQDTQQDTVRLGLHYKISPNQDLIASGIYQKNERDQLSFRFPEPGNSAFGKLFLRRDQAINTEGFYGEIQHIFRHKYIKSITGIGYTDIDRNDFFNRDIVTVATGNIEPFDSNKFLENINYFNSYIYEYISPFPNLTAIIGISYDALRTKSFDPNSKRVIEVTDRNEFNPKFGLIWEPTKTTTIRGAAFRVTKRPLAANRTIEPTQVAGFNQFFDDINGDESWRYGIGIDQKLFSNFSAGIEFSWRDLTRTSFSLDSDREEKKKRDETFHRAYLNWTPHPNIAVSTAFEFEDLNREFFKPGDGDNTNPKRIKTYSAPLSISYYSPSGLFGKLGVTYVDQKTRFVTDNITGELLDTFKEKFWVVDASIGYRLPKRYGQIKVGVSNLLDENFHYQSAGVDNQLPQLPKYQPERTFFVSFNLSLF